MSKKFTLQQMQEWTDYEIEFVDLCIERKWKVDNQEKTGSPVLYPIPKSKRNIYIVCPHDKNKNGSLIALYITAEHGKTKSSLLRKAEEANLKGEVIIDSDTDAAYVFPISRLARAVKTFNLRRKTKHTGPSKETIRKGQEALAKWRKEQK